MRSRAGSAIGSAACCRPTCLRWLLALSFFAVAAWALKPDKLDDDAAPPKSKWGVFGVTVVAFFLAEIGDKTQIAMVISPRNSRRFRPWWPARRSAC